MRGVVIAITALALAGCASFRKADAPVCDGKDRRPANLYGSVLDAAPPPTAAPDKLSALPSAFGSCGA